MSSDDDNDQSEIRYQRIATRLYIVLLVLSLVILTLCLALIPQTYVKTIEQPTRSNFSHYYSLYQSSLQCPCSEISIPYSFIFTIKPYYHQMCSSDLVSSNWLLHLNNILETPYRHPPDDRHAFSQKAGSQFILLRKLCNEAKQTIEYSLEQFLNQTFVSSQVISEEIFKEQAKTLMEEWKIFTKNNFLRTLRMIEDIQYGNHLAAHRSNSNFDLNMEPNTFVLNSLIYYDECNCMLSPSCQSPMRIYSFWYETAPPFEMSNFFVGCFPLKALLNSTLECFYNQTCIDILKSLTQIFSYTVDLTPLNGTQNYPNETIYSVVNKLFIEDWSEDISFEEYFTTCEPKSCSYEYIARPSLIFLIRSMISIYGGLSTGLQVIFLVLLWIIIKVMKGNISCRTIQRWLHTRLNEKQHLTKGTHIILVVTTLIILYFTSTFTQQITTKQIFNVSLENYEEYFARHPDTLQCPCVKISIPFEYFMNVTVASRHQICSSSFITNEWISTLSLPIPRKKYSTIDSKRTAVSFFQLLASLCQFSEQHLIEEISDLMRRNFINRNVISRQQFHKQIQSIIDQFEKNIPLSFLITFQMVRAMISDNHLMTVFETNWKWMNPNLHHPNYKKFKLYTEPMIYNGSCNCGLSSECVEESSMMSGLMVGCYPLEALLKSTLECFYNVSCFSLLQSINQSFIPLNDSYSSRYEKNSTVELILRHLMVEKWYKNVSYEMYYHHCAPSSCSYSFIQFNPALQVLTLLLGLYGGLTIIMKLVALIIVAFLQKIFIRYRQRHVQVQPM